MRHHLSKLNASRADIVINVDIENTPWFQFTNGRDKILAGEKATEAILPQLDKLLVTP